jgi:hypothetical protein
VIHPFLSPLAIIFRVLSRLSFVEDSSNGFGENDV